MRRLLRCLILCENAAAFVAAAIFLFITLSILAEVLLRYGFNRPIPWVVEISEYALLWITFLGAAWLLRQGGHVRVDILLQHLSPATLRVCGLISSASGVVVSLVLTVFGAEVTWVAWARGSYKTTGVDVPTWIVVIVIPLGGLLLLFRFFRLFVEYHQRTRDFGAESSH